MTVLLWPRPVADLERRGTPGKHLFLQRTEFAPGGGSLRLTLVLTTPLMILHSQGVGEGISRL
jgi:hypothetical protein